MNPVGREPGLWCSKKSSNWFSGLLRAMSKQPYRWEKKRETGREKERERERERERLSAYKELPFLTQELGLLVILLLKKRLHQLASIVLHFLSFCSTDFEPCFTLQQIGLLPQEAFPPLFVFTLWLSLNWRTGQGKAVQTGRLNSTLSETSR
jgi:hypothetical protein